jgi:chromatin modification-related protein VID21
MQVRITLRDRAQLSDHFDMRFEVLTTCSAIVRSRKRKLRELFAIATEVDGIPNFDFSDPDALPTTETESKFLAECDISQYVCLLF